MNHNRGIMRISRQPTSGPTYRNGWPTCIPWNRWIISTQFPRPSTSAGINQTFGPQYQIPFCQSRRPT